MPSRTHLPRRLALVAACTLACGGLRAELLKVSPFLPAQAGQNAPTANAPLEFRGVMEINDVEQYRIVVADPQKKVGSWLKAGERDANLGVLLKAYHADSDTVDVEYGGQTMTLALKVSKVVSSGVAMPVIAPPPPPPQTNVAPAVISSVVPNPTQADEQRRLEAVAAEVARRRALREQAAQAAQQGAQPGAVPPPPGVVPQQPNVTRQDLQQAQQMQQGIRRQ